jgi:hypothetical protein
VGDSHIVYGIVPDGNSTISATSPAGTMTSIPVHDNAVAAILNYLPESIAVRSIAGTAVKTI